MNSFREQDNFKGGEREGGDGRDPTPKNMCQVEERWRCTCAHPERGEAKEGPRKRFRFGIDYSKEVAVGMKNRAT
jgi:hypothetical protein